MTDEAWRTRHRDYRRQGIIVVWFWRPRVLFPHIVLSEGLPVWFYVPSHAWLGRRSTGRTRRCTGWREVKNPAVFGRTVPSTRWTTWNGRPYPSAS